MLSSQILLHDLLRQVSRSIYLSLRVLPLELRRPIGLAYLFCRVADTLADTELLAPGERLEYLGLYRQAFSEGASPGFEELEKKLYRLKPSSAEGQLLHHLRDCFRLLATLVPEDQTRIRELVLTLTQGMLMDLSLFPQGGRGGVVALRTRAELEQYTYWVAGCVGEFWTRMIMAHRPALSSWDSRSMEKKGREFGQGLQMTNILRDLAQDLRWGRCYLPEEDLCRYGLVPADLLNPDQMPRLKPLLGELLDLTLKYYQSGWAYTLAIPRREARLRLACIWPLWIGLQTLALVNHSPRLLEPYSRLKVPRSRVYALLIRSLVWVGSNVALDRCWSHLLTTVPVLE